MEKTFKILLLFIIFFSFLVLGFHQIHTDDTFFHILNGKHIVEQKTIINKNIYSFTNPDYPFANHSWLTKVVFFLIHNQFGFLGLQLLGLFLTLVPLVVIFRNLSLQKNFYFTYILMLLSLLIFQARFMIRPQLFSYLFFVIFLVFLIRYYEKPSKKLFIGLLGLQVLWNQFHAYCILGIFLLFCFFLDALVYGEKQDKKSLFLLTFLSALTLFTMPNPILFLKMYYEMFTGYKHTLFTVVGEFLPLSLFKRDYLVLFFLGITAPFILLFNKKGRLGPFLIYSFLFIESLIVFRNIAFFVLAASLFLMDHITSKNFSPKILKNNILKSLALLFLFIVLSERLIYAAPFFKKGINPYEVPIKAGAFIQDKKIEGNVLNDFNIGSYLLFIRYPNKVYIHNQVEAYDPKFFREFFYSFSDFEIFQKRLKQYDINWIFLKYRLNLRETLRFLIRSPNWNLVFIDQDYFLFLRKNAQNQKIINTTKHSTNLPILTFPELENLFNQPVVKARKDPLLSKKIHNVLVLEDLGLNSLCERAYIQLLKQQPQFFEGHLSLMDFYGKIKDRKKFEFIYQKTLEKFGESDSLTEEYERIKSGF